MIENHLSIKSRNTQILVKIDAKTDSQFGCKPDDRSIKQLLDYGLILLNKPSGPTSHQVTDTVKQILGIEKAGHSGTLEQLTGKS